MGVLFLLALFVPKLNREWRIDALAQRAGRGGPLVAGAAFALAWTPCVGPALASILGLAATQDTVGQGGALLAVYSAGLAVPFLLTAVAFNRATTAFAVRRHYAVINGVAGVLLIGMGILVFTGELSRLNIEAQGARRVGSELLPGGVGSDSTAPPMMHFRSDPWVYAIILAVIGGVLLLTGRIVGGVTCTILAVWLLAAWSRYGAEWRHKSRGGLR